MKYQALLFFLVLNSNHVQASNSHDLFGAVVGLYWCLNKTIPEKLEELNKPFGFQLPQTATQDNYESWLARVEMKVEDEELVIKSPAKNRGVNVPDELSGYTSKTDCGSIRFEEPNKTNQPDTSSLTPAPRILANSSVSVI